MIEIELSILICSLIERRSKFLDRLLTILEPQLRSNVEILVMADNSVRTIGEKRNNLIDLSRGKYFCFIDDDDRVSDDYINLILIETAKDPDVVIFDAEITTNGKDPKPVKYEKDFVHKNTPSCYYRRPNHLMVHKRSNVTERFNHVSFGEDDEWAKRRVKTIQTVQRIDKTLYFYDFSTTTKKYKPRQVKWPGQN